MKIIIAGDFCPHERVAQLIATNRYDTVLSDIKPLIEEADYSLVNMECPVVLSAETLPIEKNGSHLKAMRNTVDFIKYAGFTCITLANNHILDYGRQGIEDTFSVCKDLELDIVGAGLNLKEAGKILYKDIDKKRIAFINCCEHEFSIATYDRAGANPINPISQCYAIQEAKSNSDYVIVITHGGHEYFQYPSPRMKELYRFYIDAGADVVANHHQHCFSGYEVYKGRLIFYGLGNFCFDYSSRFDSIWNEGYLVELNITEGIKFRLIPYIQCSKIPVIVLMGEEKEKIFFQRIDHLNSIIADDNALTAIHKEWMQTYEKEIELVFNPYQNRILRAAFYRGLIPNFLTKSKRLSLLNYIECESHRDRTLEMLRGKDN